VKALQHVISVPIKVGSISCHHGWLAALCTKNHTTVDATLTGRLIGFNGFVAQ